MTHAAEGAALRFADLPSALEELRAAGLRVTAARRLVLEALFAADGPCSAEQLARAIGGDAAATYRNLEALERCGIVRHVHLGHGPGLYALVGEGEREYLHCERCGATRAVDPAELDTVRALVREQYGWQARFSHFPIVGRCPECTRDGDG
jgi:Fur family ferric uptake transcriptional regulator